jgi:hypothetical protein
LNKYDDIPFFFDKAVAIEPNDVYALDDKGTSLEELGNHIGGINLHKYQQHYQVQQLWWYRNFS